ncbi:MAG: GNAT family N-acetyltransferase [Muribaculaceae bacterium]|nr:GNAT family N-acetyltransferase [Muribaculaceae bacterium]
MELAIRRYCPEDREEWNGFVKESRNATFLFDRGYMDYHSSRFQDCSWIASKGGKTIALLPANIDAGGVLHSHQGLTYGGWLLPPTHLDGADLLEIFTEAVEIWKREGIKALDYKPVPFIYSSKPSEEDIYALFRLGARVSEVNLSSALNLSLHPDYNKLRRRSLKKASEISFNIVETEDARTFMRLTAACLAERHDTVPVHTADEILLLRDRFPENIRMFLLIREGESEPDAGVMIYDTGTVVHAQYIASTEAGRRLNLLTPLFNWLITVRYSSRRYFDFGISNEDNGRYLNEGLLRQKFSYGATGVSYSRWYLPIEDL